MVHFSHTLRRKKSIKSLVNAFLKASTKKHIGLPANNTVLVKCNCSEVQCLLDHMEINLHETFTVYLDSKCAFHHTDVDV